MYSSKVVVKKGAKVFISFTKKKLEKHFGSFPLKLAREKNLPPNEPGRSRSWRRAGAEERSTLFLP